MTRSEAIEVLMTEVHSESLQVDDKEKFGEAVEVAVASMYKLDEIKRALTRRKS